MFMEQNELNNALNLYKIRKKDMMRPLKVLFLIMTFLFLLDTITAITGLFTYNAVLLPFKLKTYTQLGVFFTMFLVLGNTVIYKSDNKKYEMLPQSNKSRFLAYVMQCYVSLGVVLIYTTLLYLIDYGILSVIANFNENVHLAYEFNFLFFISGFFVNLLYALLGASLIIFVGVLARSANLFFKVVLGLAAVFLTFFHFPDGGSILTYIILYFANEPSLLLFILKAITVIVVLSASSWFINKHTVYYKAEGHRFPRWAVITGTLFIVLTFYNAAILLSFTGKSNSHEEVQVIEESTSEYYKNHSFGQKVYSPEDFKGFNTLNIIPNFEEDLDNITIEHSKEEDNSMAFTEDLVIFYTLPSNAIDDIKYIDYTKPTLDINLEGNNLYLNYDYKKNQKLVLLDSFGFMTEFEMFKGKNYCSTVMGTMYSYNNGSVKIFCPENLNLLVKY